MDPSSVDADRQKFHALYALLRVAGRITQAEYDTLMAIQGPPWYLPRHLFPPGAPPPGGRRRGPDDGETAGGGTGTA
jgi:hypothetical protein